MAYIPRSSLINAEAQSAIPVQVKRRKTIRVFNVITTTLLALAIVGTVGVFLWKDIVENQFDNAREALNAISASTGEQNAKKIEEIRVYDNKLNIAHTLLNNHLSPTTLLDEIEASTKETVQYTDFEYAYDPGYEVMLTLSGKTETLASVVLQKMQVLRDGIFSEFVLSDISTNESVEAPTTDTKNTSGIADENVAASVGFSVKGIFKKSLIEYSDTKKDSPTFDTRTVSSTVPVLPELSPSSTLSIPELPVVSTERI